MPRKKDTYRHLGLMLTPEQYAAVERAASYANLSLAAFVREVLDMEIWDFPDNFPEWRKRGVAQRSVGTTPNPVGTTQDEEVGS